MMEENVKKALKLRSWLGIAHHIPGRVRLKYKLGIIAHIAHFNVKDIERTLDRIPAFRHYKINRSTGSILIEYDPSVISPDIIDNLFSQENGVAEQACYELAARLNLNGVD